MKCFNLQSWNEGAELEISYLWLHKNKGEKTTTEISLSNIVYYNK